MADKPPRAGRGRPKGSPNKTTAALKDMILQALDRKGGVDYLVTQAEMEPKAFMALLGRVLPMQITGEGGGPIAITTVELVALDEGAG